MGRSAKIYTRTLNSLGFGFQLWFPEPTDGQEIQIGDVGGVFNSGFRRLFNVTLPENHPYNAGGVPENFVPLSLASLIHDRHKHCLSPGAYGSTSVTTVVTRAKVAGGYIPGSAGAVGYSFTCSDEEGAMLLLKSSARSDSLCPNEVLSQYMKKHHQDWYELAKSRYHWSCKPEDIILVNGWIKISQWTVAAFKNNSTG
ncbi:hypothetical protein PHLCEN_2v8931 [Hermanssonia centrifuga]|uniref:Uncharacterized protein n=1 Tax=Hermanssonia centrifuga TaxID=98765 RepID=A0A2R6NRZ9_9APHY|nr:hypothetical protein PHLCEN_2v8931 [Hermanssonia centrifuga]